MPTAHAVGRILVHVAGGKLRLTLNQFALITAEMTSRDVCALIATTAG